MIIYKTTINGKPYVGQTSYPLKNRIYRHNKEAGVRKDYFHRAIRKYGAENCQWEILHKCSSKEEMDVMETFFIQLYCSHVSQGGYNLTWGGEGTIGYKHTAETKRKIGLKLANPSEETRRKMRESGIKKVFTDNHRRNISESVKGEKNGFYGKTHSEKTLRKIKQKRKLQIFTKAIRQKMSEAQKKTVDGRHRDEYGKWCK